MKIDRQAETLGRKVVRWAGGNDEEKFLDALVELSEAKDDLGRQAISIYVGVAALANATLYKGGTPNQAQNQKRAEEILRARPWDLTDLRGLYNLLEGLSVPEKPVPLDTPGEIANVFLFVGYVTAWYCENAGYEDPYDFLDALLATLASLPEQ